jgi:hypothetical protein
MQRSRPGKLNEPLGFVAWRGWLKLENRCSITHQAFANFARDFPSLVGRSPLCPRRLQWLNSYPRPPFHFRSGAMQLAVMGMAARDEELVTDLLSESPQLGKAAADEATLLGNKAQVLPIALPRDFWQDGGAVAEA